jgi:hypothetical protein
MNDKFLLFYYFTEGSFHANAATFMSTSLIKKLDKYLGKYNSKYSKNICGII